MPTEGQTATGPNGQRAVFTGGRWVVQSGPQMPADPTYPFQGQKAAADAVNAQANATGQQIQNSVTAGTAPTTIQTNQAPAGTIWNDPNDPSKGVRPIPGYVPPQQQESAAERTDKEGRISRLNQLIAQINRVQTLYDDSVGKTKGVQGLKDRLPTDANERFDTAGAALSQQGLAAFRIPGTGNVSDRDAIMFDRANLPTAATRDSRIEEQLRGLRSRVNEEYKSLGLSIPKWEGQVAQDERESWGGDRPEGNAWQQNHIISGGGPGAAAFGATEQSVPVDPQYQAELTAFLGQWAANPDPQAYIAKRIELDQKYNYGSDQEAYATWANTASEALKQGGATIDPIVPGMNVPMSAVDQLRNNAINNPVAAGAVGFGDMLGFGALSALAPEQMQAVSDAYPVSSTVGQMGGAIAGTALLGGAGGQTIGRLAPALLRGGKWGQAARGVATDATYSGIYGNNTGADPLESAAFGTLGSVGGQVAGRSLGAIATGARMTPAAQYLASKNIPQTIGQKVGGFVKKAEDAMSSLPVVGDMVGSRMTDSFRGFNRAAFDDPSFARIGARTEQMGEEGAANLIEQTGDYYRSATAGVDVPLDDQFLRDIEAARRVADKLPQEARGAFQQAIDNVVNPITDAGNLTGEAFHGSIKNLKGLGVPQAAQGFDDLYKGGLRQTRDALRGQVERGGGADVVEKLGYADEAYRNAKTLQDAVKRARNGTRSGEIQTFAPSQLNDAGWATNNKYPGTRPFSALADAGQESLPSKLPDSGTGRRLIQAGLGATALGGAGAADFANGTGENPVDSNYLRNTAIITALLTAGGTKTGQKALDTMVINRPELMRQAGQNITRRAGLFGSATLPLTITGY